MNRNRRYRRNPQQQTATNSPPYTLRRLMQEYGQRELITDEAPPPPIRIYHDSDGNVVDIDAQDALAAITDAEEQEALEAEGFPQEQGVY